MCMPGKNPFVLPSRYVTQQDAISHNTKPETTSINPDSNVESNEGLLIYKTENLHKMAAIQTTTKQSKKPKTVRSVQ